MHAKSVTTRRRCLYVQMHIISFEGRLTLVILLHAIAGQHLGLRQVGVHEGAESGEVRAPGDDLGILAAPNKNKRNNETNANDPLDYQVCKCASEGKTHLHTMHEKILRESATNILRPHTVGSKHTDRTRGSVGRGVSTSRKGSAGDPKLVALKLDVCGRWAMMSLASPDDFRRSSAA